jgi:hypothetical protein
MLISRYSSRAHELVLRFLSVTAPGGAAAWSCPLCSRTVGLPPSPSSETATDRTYDLSVVSSTGPLTRSARPQALRRVASSRQAVDGCRCAPRPPADRRRSGASAVPAPLPTATIRISSDLAARSRHPTQVRTGSGRAWASEERGFVRPTESESSGYARQRRIGLDDPSFLGGGVGADVDAPAGQASREPRVLSLFADGQGQLEVRYDDPRGLGLGIHDLHARDPSG